MQVRKPRLKLIRHFCRECRFVMLQNDRFCVLANWNASAASRHYAVFLLLYHVRLEIYTVISFVGMTVFFMVYIN